MVAGSKQCTEQGAGAGAQIHESVVRPARGDSHSLLHKAQIAQLITHAFTPASELLCAPTPTADQSKPNPHTIIRLQPTKVCTDDV